LLLIALGLVAYGLGVPGARIAGVTLDVYTILFGSLSIITGYQSIIFAVVTKVFAITEGTSFAGPSSELGVPKNQPGKGLVAGAMTIAAGIVLRGSSDRTA
jgi:hypothetical protein